MSIRLYVEGGGDSKLLRSECRKGFRLFMERAGLTGRMPRIVASGDREKAFGSFVTAQSDGAGTPILLVDAEDAVTAAYPWQHLSARDGWNRPAGATEAQCHLMVQVMESWFLADRQALTAFYGPCFQDTALPRNPNVEQVPKSDVMAGLAHATRNTQKGRYDKGSHSFAILAALDPAKVERVAPHARRFLEALRGRP